MMKGTGQNRLLGTKADFLGLPLVGGRLGDAVKETRPETSTDTAPFTPYGSANWAVSSRLSEHSSARALSPCSGKVPGSFVQSGQGRPSSVTGLQTLAALCAMSNKMAKSTFNRILQLDRQLDRRAEISSALSLPLPEARYHALCSGPIRRDGQPDRSPLLKTCDDVP